MLDKYQNQYDESGYSPKCPYSRPLFHILPSEKMWEEVNDLLGEKLFYENRTNIYYGAFRREHEEKISQATQRASRQDNMEFWIIFTIVSILVLGVCVLFFELIAGAILFAVGFFTFIIQALKEGGDVK